MGSSNSKNIDVTHLDLLEWKQVGIHRQTSKIVQSLNNRGVAELQTITFDPKRNLQKQINIYQYRKSTNNPLVKCLGVIQQKVKNSTICGSNHALRVLTERIPLRLNQLPQLSFPETLYTLSESLRGYKDCYNKVGPFDVYDQMIGVNQQGDVKVWVNENFAENHPQIEKPLLQTSGSQIRDPNQQGRVVKNSQAEMVDNILKLIEKKNEFGQYPQDFASRVYGRNLGFDEAFKQIEQFSRERNIFVPQRLNSLSSKLGFQQQQPDIQTTIDRTSTNTVMMNPARRLFEEETKQTERVFSPIIYNQTERKSLEDQKGQYAPQTQVRNAGSPIKILFGQSGGIEQIQSPQRRTFNAPPPTMMSPRSQAVGSKVTFRLVSPESAFSFQRNNSQFSNRM